MRTYTIALVGNTNVGKTTFLNVVCDLDQEIGNYPGTTVELFKAQVNISDRRYEIIDLPGVYSLTPFSDEEKVTRKALLEEEFDLIVQVIDPNYKKRSLAFMLELMELEKPLFLVINNKDNLWNKAELFLVALKNQWGIEGVNFDIVQDNAKKIFFDKIADYLPINSEVQFSGVHYDKILRTVHASIIKEIDEIEHELKSVNIWIILKILEEDLEIVDQYVKNRDHKKIIFKNKDQDYSLIIKNNRFCFAERFLEKTLRIPSGQHRYCNNNCPQVGQHCFYRISDKIDAVLLNKWLGIPIFLVLMWAVFELTFTIGAMPMYWIDSLIALLQTYITRILPVSMWSSLLIDGIIGGVGAILAFLPPIILLFFFLSLLQQSGYLARTAYLLDNMMQKIGLSGKSFVPLLMGFGCSVPAVMATRTLTGQKEKIITAMMIPFMSCGAKFPVYMIFIAAFVDQVYQGSVLFIIYFIGIILGIFSGFIINKFINEEKRSLLLELPIYALPKLKNIWRYVWHAVKQFLNKAGIVILPFSVFLWFLFSFPIVDHQTVPLEETYAAMLGKTIEPIFKPLGFDWRLSISLISGLGAKEIIISTLATIYALNGEDNIGLIAALHSDSLFTPAVVAALMIFVLIYTPCLPVLAMIYQDFGYKWMIFVLLYPFILAWIISFMVFSLGSFLLI